MCLPLLLNDYYSLESLHTFPFFVRNCDFKEVNASCSFGVVLPSIIKFKKKKKKKLASLLRPLRCSVQGYGQWCQQYQ